MEWAFFLVSTTVRAELCEPLRLRPCTREYRPRCGKNGVTYANLCTAENACQGDTTEGPCPTLWTVLPEESAELAVPLVEEISSPEEKQLAPDQKQPALPIGNHYNVLGVRYGRSIPGTNDPQNWRKLDRWLAGSVTVGGTRVGMRWIVSIVLVAGIMIFAVLSILRARTASLAAAGNRDRSHLSSPISSSSTTSSLRYSPQSDNGEAIALARAKANATPKGFFPIPSRRDSTLAPSPEGKRALV